MANVNWVRVYNRLLEIINPGDDKHPNYFSGRRFIDVVRETDNYHPTYTQYIEKMKSEGVMKSRKDYFIDILDSFNPVDRVEIIRSILSMCQNVDDLKKGIEKELGLPLNEAKDLQADDRKEKTGSLDITQTFAPNENNEETPIESKGSWWGEDLLGLPSEKEYEQHFEKLIQKRMDQAEPYLQQLVHEGVVKMNIETLRAEFRKYYEAKENVGDLQIKDGDFDLEDGDFKVMPDIEFEDFENFTKRFRDFAKFMKDKGMIPNKDADIDKIVNHGNMIVNQQSNISEQSVNKNQTDKQSEESQSINWTKWGVIVTVAIGIITIIIMLASS
ncbi:MAG: hypothetical protein JXR03_19925 [Cyclobacteriaceae bacterium]